MVAKKKLTTGQKVKPRNSSIRLRAGSSLPIDTEQLATTTVQLYKHIGIKKNAGGEEEAEEECFVILDMF